MSATARYVFHVQRSGNGAPKRLQAGRTTAPEEKVPRVARLLALAHKFQGMLDRGEAASMAELARLGRVSRARITQIMDLLMLAPEIQEQVLSLAAGDGRGDPVGLLELQAICRAPDWRVQRQRWATGLQPLQRKPAI